MDAIETARRTGLTIVVGATLLLALAATTVAFATGTQGFAVLAGAVVLSLAGGYGRQQGGPVGRLLAAGGLLGVVMLLTAALAGHPWQLDSHMIYFAAMAVLVTLVDPVVLIFGAALVAGQHVALGALLPALVYPAADLWTNLQRAIFHGLILAAETAVLVYTVRLRKTQVEAVSDSQASVEEALKDARLAAEEARTAQNVLSDVVVALRQALQRLAERDLETRINEAFPPEHEQLRGDFNRALAQLSDAMADVSEKAVRIGGSAREISSASDDLSRRTETQAATLEETAAALNELTSSVNSAADRAREVEGIVGEAREQAETSGSVVQSAVSAMNAIEKSSQEISQIVGVIDDIAFQTNLLALNAGVEAARAGEAGKGFTVVASEVRVLAQRSSDAAREIKELISGSTRQVEEGVALVGKAGDALTNIAKRVDHISDLVTEIARGTVEQAQGLGEINTGVNSLDQVTQQNAAMVEESTAASHTLATEAQDLTEAMSAFRMKGSARAAGDVATPVALKTRGAAGKPSIAPTPIVIEDAPSGRRAAAGDTWEDF